MITLMGFYAPSLYYLAVTKLFSRRYGRPSVQALGSDSLAWVRHLPIDINNGKNQMFATLLETWQNPCFSTVRVVL